MSHKDRRGRTGLFLETVGMGMDCIKGDDVAFNKYTFFQFYSGYYCILVTSKFALCARSAGECKYRGAKQAVEPRFVDQFT